MRIIFDLDGTLRDATHRKPLLPSAADRADTSKWVAYNAAGASDAPVHGMIALLESLAATADWIVIGTSCGDAARESVELWLERHGLVGSYDQLIMREMSDHRSTLAYKRALFETFRPDLIVDDNPGVVELANSMGIVGMLVKSYDPYVLEQLAK